MELDCAGYKKDAHEYCTCLTDMLCRRGNCTFYKTKAQAEADQRASFEKRCGMCGPFTGYDKKYLEEGKGHGN